MLASWRTVSGVFIAALELVGTARALLLRVAPTILKAWPLVPVKQRKWCRMYGAEVREDTVIRIYLVGGATAPSISRAKWRVEALRRRGESEKR